MTKSLSALTAAVVVGLAAQAGVAQVRTLQWDINNLTFQSRDVAGAPAPFGGLTHTGSVLLSELIPPSGLELISIRTGAGPFTPQPGPYPLTDLSMIINLSSGMVTGGTFLLDVNGGPGGGGDRYTATIGAAGTVTPFVGGGFKVEGLTSAGLFSDAQFATVGVADFFAAQGGPGGLTGSFLSFRINPDPNGAGIADLDAFVTVPSPGTMACLGAAAMFFMPRRRR